MTMDPYLIIKKYAGCPLNPSKSKPPELHFSTIYNHITGKELTNAHNSLEHCKAQAKVMAWCADFSKYKDMKQSILILTIGSSI